MTHSTIPLTRYVGTAEAADLCGFSRRTFEKKRVTGGGPRFIKRGKKVLYDVADLEAWMRAGARHSTSEEGVDE